jgi:hypothetical protein
MLPKRNDEEEGLFGRGAKYLTTLRADTSQTQRLRVRQWRKQSHDDFVNHIGE